MFMNTGLYMNSDQMMYNVSTNPIHLFQHGGIQITLINNNGLYIEKQLPVIYYLRWKTKIVLLVEI